jgi:hypothetical protein
MGKEEQAFLEKIREHPLTFSLCRCGSRTMMKREFDIVIIDEATQALEGMKRNKPNTQWVIHRSVVLFLIV